MSRWPRCHCGARATLGQVGLLGAFLALTTGEPGRVRGWADLSGWPNPAVHRRPRCRAHIEE